MNLTLIALLGIAIMVGFVFLGMNVGISMMLVGIVGYALVAGDFKLAISRFGTVPFTTANSYSFVVMPLFVLMGEFTLESGMSNGLYSCCEKWLGKFRGGLNLATIVSNGVFGAICGSNSAAVATIGKLALAETRRYNYDDDFTMATAAAGGTISWLIPPSTGFILYGITAGNLSIGRLFASGIVPGLMLIVAFMLTSTLLCMRRPEIAPRGRDYTLREKVQSFVGVIPIVLLFTVVLGGMFSGIFSYTEAAAIGALMSLLYTFIARRMTWKGFWLRCRNALKSTLMVFQIMIAANIFGYFLTVTNLPQNLANWITSMDIAPWLVLMCIFLLYVIIGMFMDGLSAVMLTVPIFCPIISAMGYDLVWFGTILVLVMVLGAITPPIGLNIFVAAGVDRAIQINRLMKYCVPYAIAMGIVTIIIIFVPDLALWLPNVIYGA